MIPLPKLEICQEVTFLSFEELHKKCPTKFQYTHGGLDLSGIKGIITHISYNKYASIYEVDVKFKRSDFDILHPPGNLEGMVSYGHYRMQENEFEEYYKE